MSVANFPRHNLSSLLFGAIFSGPFCPFGERVIHRPPKKPDYFHVYKATRIREQGICGVVAKKQI